MVSMSKRQRRILPNFRRGLEFVWPHKGYLAWAMLAVLGVSVFYTLSITSVMPFLKIMFTHYETVADWVYRVDAEERLGCLIQPDFERDAETGRSLEAGIHLIRLSPHSPLKISEGQVDRILSVGEVGGGHYEMLKGLRDVPSGEPVEVTLAYADGTVRRDEVTLEPGAWTTPYLAGLAEVLPAGHDPISRTKTLATVMGALIVITLLGGICRFVHEYMVALVCQRALIDIRTKGCANLLRLPMAWFGQNRAGDTLSRFAADSGVLEHGFTTLFGKTVREPLKAIGVLGLAGLSSPYLLGAIAVVGPIGGILMRKFGKKIRRAQRRALMSWGRLINLLSEKINGIRVVKGYHMERREALNFFRNHRVMMRETLRIIRIDALISPLLEVLGVLAVSGIVLAGGYFVFRHMLAPETFVLLVLCIAATFDPIRKLSDVNNRLQAADVAAHRLFEILDSEPEEAAEDCRVLASLPTISEGIEFRDVWFAYPNNPDRWVLQDINLSVAAGEIIAVVGPNGSGKTTLCSLLMRFYQPQKGQVLIDGVDIARGTLGSLRGQIGLVTQDTVIFSDTVRANIAYGRRGATEQDILAAARTAYADEFVNELRTERDGGVTEGYDALVNDRSLSGGQKQRIAIARAILRDPAILIFDEATSQIDADSEAKIQAALHEIMRHRTTFVIAHRFSTISQAHRIVVMEEGRIVDLGKHDELMQSCPLYQTLYETQLREAG